MLRCEGSVGKWVQVTTLSQVFFQNVDRPSALESPGVPIKHALL